MRIFDGHPFRQLDPVSDALIIASILAVGAGIGYEANSLMNPPKKPDQAALPNQADANKTANNTVSDQRTAMLKSGGITDYTGGMGLLIGSDVSTSTLVGG